MKMKGGNVCSGGINMWLADLIGGVVALLLGSSVILFSLQLQYKSEFGPGPGFLPLWIGFVITGCSIALIVKVLRKHEGREDFFKPSTKMGVLVIIEIIIAFLLSYLVGYSIALGLFVGATMRTMGKHRWITCALTSVATAVCIYFIFGRWLDIPLPKGLVGF
jgi:putative tricarboxylic transport membrane protein